MVVSRFHLSLCNLQVWSMEIVPSNDSFKPNGKLQKDNNIPAMIIESLKPSCSQRSSSAPTYPSAIS